MVRASCAGLLAVQGCRRLGNLLLLNGFGDEEIGIGLRRDLNLDAHAIGGGVAGAEISFDRTERACAGVGGEPELAGAFVEIQAVDASVADGLSMGIVGQRDDLAAEIIDGAAGGESRERGRDDAGGDGNDEHHEDELDEREAGVLKSPAAHVKLIGPLCRRRFLRGRRDRRRGDQTRRSRRCCWGNDKCRHCPTDRREPWTYPAPCANWGDCRDW